MTGGPDVDEHHVVVGAGPAGLTAAWQLARMGRAVTVLEQDAEGVGGLARTLSHAGHRYDIGPHRFYTKSRAVRDMWAAMLPGGFVPVQRLTRIHYRRRFFPYPLALGQTLAKLGPGPSLAAAASWAWAQARPRKPETSFEDWVVNRFGRRLYEAFFRTYTEKVWGLPCARIDKDWAAQRIRGLSLPQLVRAALPGRRSQVASLIDRFDYPRRGAGSLWEAVAAAVADAGGRVLLGRRVVGVSHADGRVTAVTTADGERHAGSHFHLTLTLKDLVEALDPAPPDAVLAAGRALRHRDFMTVMLVVPRRDLFPDQWIYVHDPEVRVARITNYANWNAELSPAGATTTALGMEYFCDAGDDLWAASDDAVLTRAADELAAIGLSTLPAGGGVPEGRVHRILDAYPIYDDGYRERRRLLADWIGRRLANASPAGRKGLHNYNSQDHAMMSATLGVRNLIEGAGFDVWSVNTEAEYAEEGAARGDIEERLVPRAVPQARPGETRPPAGEHRS